MRDSDRNLEAKVGLFVLIGLTAIGYLVVQFGRLGEGIQGHYPINVDFPDASGLYKGAEVLMSGARVGRVSERPVLLPDGQGVRVVLSVYNDIKLPKEATLRVGSSGLLGDRFVQVRATDPIDENTVFMNPGDTVRGEREAGIDDLARDGKELIADLRKTVESIRVTVEDRLKDGVLAEENVQNIKVSLESFKKSMESLTATLEKAPAWGENFDKTLSELQELVSSANRVVNELERGDGILPALLRDGEIADNIRAFTEGLRSRGVLFYRDPDREESTREPTSGPPSRPGGRPSR
ncbi:MAG: MlaD family protein [Verrucomicrobiales bacterium]